MWSINVNLRLLKAAIEFVWWGGGGGVCKVIFMSNYSVEVVLCCVFVGVVTKCPFTNDIVSVNYISFNILSFDWLAMCFL